MQTIEKIGKTLFEKDFTFHKIINMYRNFFKRLIDIFLSGIALIVLSPIILIIWIWLSIANKGAGAFSSKNVLERH